MLTYEYVLVFIDLELRIVRVVHVATDYQVLHTQNRIFMFSILGQCVWPTFKIIYTIYVYPNYIYFVMLSSAPGIYIVVCSFIPCLQIKSRLNKVSSNTHIHVAVCSSMKVA